MEPSKAHGAFQLFFFQLVDPQAWIRPHSKLSNHKETMDNVGYTQFHSHP